MEKHKISKSYRNSLTEILGLASKPENTNRKAQTGYFKPKLKPSTARSKIIQEQPIKKSIEKRKSSVVIDRFQDILTIRSKPLIEAWEKFPSMRLSNLIKFNVSEEFTKCEESFKRSQIRGLSGSNPVKMDLDLPAVKLEGWE